MARETQHDGVLRRLAGDRRGVSAVEFALIAPVMIFFYLGLAEFCQGFMAQKRMGRTAATVADLVTQAQTVTPQEISDIFLVGDLMMRPFPTDTLQQRVSSVTRQSATRVTVDWSRGQGLAARGGGSTVSVPDGLIGVGESLVMTEISYDYESPVGYLLPDLTRFSHTYYLRPRKVDRIACLDC